MIEEFKQDGPSSQEKYDQHRNRGGSGMGEVDTEQ